MSPQKERSWDKAKCPNCGSENSVEVYYGLRPSRERMMQMLTDKGGPEWGGHCVQEPWDPTNRCSNCGKAFGQTMEMPRSPEEWKAYYDSGPTIDLVLHPFEHGHPILGCRSAPRPNRTK
jgi:hypothetical protein